MNCKLFMALSEREQIKYIGSIVHACQSSDILYTMGQEIIKTGEEMGLFDGVTIAPEIERNKQSDAT